MEIDIGVEMQIPIECVKKFQQRRKEPEFDDPARPD